MACEFLQLLFIDILQKTLKERTKFHTPKNEIPRRQNRIAFVYIVSSTLAERLRTVTFCLGAACVRILTYLPTYLYESRKKIKVQCHRIANVIVERHRVSKPKRKA